jgi:DNA-binding PadR family transcriptional regulator
MSVARTLLALLEPEPAHGYTLKRRYDDRFSRVKPLAFGQVYASLSRFERDGLATVAGTQSGEGPERILYAITPEGVTAVESWMYTPEPPTSYASSTLLTKVTLALMSGRDAAGVLDAQRRLHLDRMRALTAARRGAAAPELLALTYELAHLDADLRWIEEAGQRLDELRHDLRDELAGEPA